MTDRPGRGPAAKRAAKAYQGTFEAVAALLIAIGVGYWMDERYDTAPWWMMVGVTIGFAAMVVRLLRMRKLVEPGADLAEDD
jgi:F0F1-type ATP synthase assembly protein I